jgi:DNA repair exonuclease SbcCD ATPase subunit
MALTPQERMQDSSDNENIKQAGSDLKQAQAQAQAQADKQAQADAKAATEVQQKVAALEAKIAELESQRADAVAMAPQFGTVTADHTGKVQS